MSFDLPTLWYAAITFLFAGYFMPVSYTHLRAHETTE